MGREYSLKSTPGRQRPARPRRCCALAREMGSASSAARLDCALYVVILFSPESITNTTSSTVIEVSAMFVLTMIFLAPSLGGKKMRRCSAGGCASAGGEAPSAPSARCNLNGEWGAVQWMRLNALRHEETNGSREAAKYMP